MTDLELYLDSLGVRFNPDRDGDQSVQCVFHQDRHASASLNLGKGLFYCFTCGAKGDVIALIRHERGVSYEAAVQILQEVVGGSGGGVSEGRQPRGKIPEPGTGYRPRVGRKLQAGGRRRPTSWT